MIVAAFVLALVILASFIAIFLAVLASAEIWAESVFIVASISGFGCTIANLVLTAIALA